MNRTISLAAAVVASTVALPAHAQGWPAKSIRMILPVPPSGTSDILARMIGQKLTEAWNQQLIIDSRPGAIGVDILARATRRLHPVPDGCRQSGDQSQHVFQKNSSRYRARNAIPHYPTYPPSRKHQGSKVFSPARGRACSARQKSRPKS